MSEEFEKNRLINKEINLSYKNEALLLYNEEMKNLEKNSKKVIDLLKRLLDNEETINKDIIEELLSKINFKQFNILKENYRLFNLSQILKNDKKDLNKNYNEFTKKYNDLIVFIKDVILIEKLEEDSFLVKELYEFNENLMSLNYLNKLLYENI